MSANPLMARRAHVMGSPTPLFYDEPIEIVRGEGVRLWDAAGREYLDCYNNVPCIGHCHPRFIKAVSAQMGVLNTHTRYLHEGIVNYLESLTSTFQVGFEGGILTCTGSEANDIALRMAWQQTGARGIIATDHTYHGNTHLVSQLSHDKTPIGGHESFIRFVKSPDSYRGADAGAFAADIETKIQALKDAGHGFAALIICPLFANEGFPDLPKGWLDEAAKIVRAHGGLLICDEVQSGLGRSGTFWAHERIGVVPDIVTLGKPLAAGHPVGAVITHSEILNNFRAHYGYFNTFGGNPVSVMAAQTTLDILLEENLAQNAKDVGDYAKSRLRELQTEFECIGDVRGAGLFFGIEFVENRETKAPDAARTKRIVEAMKAKGVLLNRLGIHFNTLKIRPPLVFSRTNADELLGKLEEAIREDIS